VPEFRHGVACGDAEDEREKAEKDPRGRKRTDCPYLICLFEVNALVLSRLCDILKPK
jgi:hypothetical protein